MMNVAPKHSYNKVSRLKTAQAVASQAKVETLPTPELPLWLKFLLLFQRSSGILTVGLIAAAGIVYAQTNNTPKQWTKEYHKLRSLERDERNLIATNESLKNQIALKAEKKETGFVNSVPDSVVFIAPTPESQIKNILEINKTTNILKPDIQGY